MFDTMTYGDGVKNTIAAKPAASGLKVSRRRPVNHDTFQAAASGLGSMRDQFYSPTGRMPNASNDDTRRRRNLVGGSGNRHLGQLDLWTEREISRALRDYSEIFEGMISEWSTEVIQVGFMCRPDTGDDNTNAVVKEALFGYDGDGGWFGECDARDLLHWWDLLSLAEETELTDGDHAFFLDPSGNEGRGTVSIIEGDRILTPSTYVPSENGRQCFNGIEVDEDGKATRVFVAFNAPETPFCQYDLGQWLPVFDRRQPELGGVLLAVYPKRYTSTRRQPWLSTAVRAHDEIEDTFIATRIALRNIACRSTYTRISDYDAFSDWLKMVDPENGFTMPEEALEHSPNPGDHHYTNPGEEIGVLESNTPGNNFEPFAKLNFRLSGLPLGMGLESSLKIFDKSFSANRLSLQGTRRRYKKRQRHIKRRKFDPVKLFAIARLQEVGELAKANSTIVRMIVRPPVWPYIEPQKDANAAETLRRLNVKSSTTIAEEIGEDYEHERTLIENELPVGDASAAADPPGATDDEE